MTPRKPRAPKGWRRLRAAAKELALVMLKDHADSGALTVGCSQCGALAEVLLLLRMTRLIRWRERQPQACYTVTTGTNLGGWTMTSTVARYSKSRGPK